MKGPVMGKSRSCPVLLLDQPWMGKPIFRETRPGFPSQENLWKTDARRSRNEDSDSMSWAQVLIRTLTLRHSRVE